MVRFLSTALIFLVAVFVSLGPVGAAGFRHKGLDGDAERFEAWPGANWKPNPKNARRDLAEGEKLMAGAKDPRGASRHFANAVVSAPESVTMLSASRVRISRSHSVG